MLTVTVKNHTITGEQIKDVVAVSVEAIKTAIAAIIVTLEWAYDAGCHARHWYESPKQVTRKHIKALFSLARRNLALDSVSKTVEPVDCSELSTPKPKAKRKPATRKPKTKSLTDMIKEEAA